MIELKYEMDFKKHALWRSSLKTRLWTRESQTTTEELQREYFKHIVERTDIKFWGLWSDKEYIGTAGLTDIDYLHGTAEFSLLIGEEYQRRGHGTEALIALCNYGFDLYGLHTIFGETFCYPLKAKKLLEANQQRLLPLHSLYKETEGEWYVNPASIVFDRAGFELEGMLRSRYLKFGHRVNTLLVSIVRDKWKHSRLHY